MGIRQKEPKALQTSLFGWYKRYSDRWRNRIALAIVLAQAECDLFAARMKVACGPKPRAIASSPVNVPSCIQNAVFVDRAPHPALPNQRSR